MSLQLFVLSKHTIFLYSQGKKHFEHSRLTAVGFHHVQRTANIFFSLSLTIAYFCFLPLIQRHSIMEDPSGNKPYMVTSSLNFKVTAPSFYNQPKKFASVAPPRPKSQTPPSGPSPTPVGTAVIGRVGDLPPPPPTLSDGICIIYAFFCDHF